MRNDSGIGRAAQRGRRVGLGLSVAVLAGLTSLVATVPSAHSASVPASTSGYWLLGTDGGIFSYGTAGFFGSTGAIPLNQPIVGMAATPDGRGYWMVASDGGIFAFGDAVFYGSMGATHLNKPIVDIAATPDGRGYWMTASDGGIFAFGDAGFFGSTGAIKLAKRIQAMSPTPDGRGYWMVAGDGGVFSFGDAGFFGSAAADGASDKRVVDIAPSATGQGYYITASNGAVNAYGDAQYFGGASDQHLTHGIIGLVAINSGAPPVAGDDTLTVQEDGVGTVDVLVNDHDADGGPLTVTDVSKPGHGTATFAIGTVGYRPAPNYHGIDAFTYTVTDPQGNTATGLVNVTVQAVNDLPDAKDDNVTVGLGGPATINVLGNDTGLGDGVLSLSIETAPTQIHNGTAAVSADGHSIVFTPSHKGTDTLAYRVTDNNGDNSEATVHITVTGADIAPKAVDDTVPCCQTDLGGAPGINLGDNGTITLEGEQNGSATSADGTFTRTGTTVSFTPNPGVTTGSTKYTISDDNFGTAPAQQSTATLTFVIPTATNDGAQNPVPAFTAADGHFTAQVADNSPLTYVIDGATGPAGDATGLFHLTDPQKGTFHFDGGQPGTYTVTFHVTDGPAQSNPATYTIQVV